MTRRLTRKAKPAAKPSAKAAQRAPRREVPISVDELNALTAGGNPSPTSLSLATSQKIDPGNYRLQERDAAASVGYASDYGMRRDASDALTFVEATGWPGFQTLGLLGQLPEYRTMHETLADEAVRTWGQITSTSDDDGAVDKIEQLTDKLKELDIRKLARTAVIHDQAYGGAHIFAHLKTKGSAVPTDSPLLLTPAFVAKDCVEGFSAVEPLWVTPNAYNASDPTAPDFYKPTSWYMLSKVVHATRLHTVISRPVSDLLKAAYSFRGVSLTQLAMPYVDNWLRTRQSVSDVVKQFSITYLKTDMAQMLQPGGAVNLIQRVQLFNATRDNRNVAICDKESEEFAQINTPLSGLDKLQAQAQEQMCAVSRQPLVKAFGITPSGLNANSDGEIRVWYDHVAGYQEANLTPLMDWILRLLQLSEFGSIDEGLSWTWNPLYELDDKELAEVRDKQSNTDQRYVDMGVLSQGMVQRRLQQDPNSGYSAIVGDPDMQQEIDDLAEQVANANDPDNQEDNADGPDAGKPDAEGKAARTGSSGASR